MRLPALCLAVLSACAVPPAGLEPETPGPVVVLPPLLRADGTLGAWDSAPALPLPRANHCAVEVDGLLLVAGGNYKPAGGTTFVTLDDVWTASVAADGTLGPWRSAGRLPAPAIECVLASRGRTVFLLGGLFEDPALGGNVWSAELSADGALGTWKLLGTLPLGRRALSGGAAVRGSTLLVSDAALSNEGDEAFLASAALGDTLGPWTKTKYGAQFRGKPQGAFTADAAFLLGGYNGGQNDVVTDATAFALAADGTPGAPVATTALPAPRTFGAAAEADGWVFVLGGRDQVLGAPQLATVFAAKAQGAALGSWTTQRALPEARGNHTATVVRNHLFVVGGGNGAGGLDTVFRARVRFEAPAL